MNFAATPRLPRALLHDIKVYERTFVRDGPGGQSRPVDKAIKTFKGIVMPLSNKDLKDLPEGTYTENSQMPRWRSAPTKSSRTPSTARDTPSRRRWATTASTL